MARVRLDGADALRYLFEGFQRRQKEAMRRAVAQAAEDQIRDAFGPGALPYPVEARMDGVRVRAVIHPPRQPSARRSASLARYDRLAPHVPDDSIWAGR